MPVPFVEGASFFPLYNFSFFANNQVSIGMWIDVRVFSMILLIRLSIFLPIPSYFYYYNSVEKLEVRDSDAYRTFCIV